MDRHGAQNVVENCTSVARRPSGYFSSAPVIRGPVPGAPAPGPCVLTLRSRPLARCQAKPPATATASAAASAISPAVTLC